MSASLMAKNSGELLCLFCMAGVVHLPTLIGADHLLSNACIALRSWVSGGEYIQMSGRAGRRGKDDRGKQLRLYNVINLCTNYTLL